MGRAGRAGRPPSGRRRGRMASPEMSAATDPGGPARRHGWPAFLVRWLRGRRAGRDVAADSAEPKVRVRNICISREAGAGGGTIARLVGTRLDWKVFDHEIVEAIAQRMGVTAEEVRALDELSPSVIQDWLLPIWEEHYAPLEAYLDHLAKLVGAIGQAGESIIVGRGANFMLPRDETLCVRVLAPMKARAQRLAERMGVSIRTARRAAHELDQRRRKFSRTMHRADPADPHHY